MLQEPQDARMCTTCGLRVAETRDGLFCLICLRELIEEMNPDVPYFSDEIGRKPSRSWECDDLDMRPMEDWDDDSPGY